MKAAGLKIFLPDGTTVEHKGTAEKPLVVEIEGSSISVRTTETKETYAGMPYKLLINISGTVNR
jgi:hypothetical protein